MAKNELEITDVQNIRHWEAKDKKTNLKAFFDIVVNGALVIRGCKIVDGEHGLFLSWPSRKTNNDERPFIDIAYLLDKDTHKSFTKTCVDAYEKSKKAEDDDI